MKAKLAKLSVCPCGFPLLNESIHLGQEYEIEPKRTGPMTLICGGCKTVIQLTCVFVHSRETPFRLGAGGFLPLEVFQTEPVEKGSI